MKRPKLDASEVKAMSTKQYMDELIVPVLLKGLSACTKEVSKYRYIMALSTCLAYIYLEKWSTKSNANITKILFQRPTDPIDYLAHYMLDQNKLSKISEDTEMAENIAPVWTWELHLTVTVQILY